MTCCSRGQRRRYAKGSSHRIYIIFLLYNRRVSIYLKFFIIIMKLKNQILKIIIMLLIIIYYYIICSIRVRRILSIIINCV